MIFTLRRAEKSEICPTVEKDHYLQRWPDPRSIPFGYILEKGGNAFCWDGRPWGLVVFKKPQHLRQKGLFGYPGLPTHWQVLDLARVWVHPVLQDIKWFGPNRHGGLVQHRLCIFSRMVAMAFRTLNVDWLSHHPPVFPELPYHLALVISYCDLSHHDGTGYRASGFEWLGMTSDRTKEVYVRRLRVPRWKWQPKSSVAAGPNFNPVFLQNTVTERTLNGTPSP